MSAYHFPIRSQTRGRDGVELEIKSTEYPIHYVDVITALVPIICLLSTLCTTLLISVLICNPYLGILLLHMTRQHAMRYLPLRDAD